MDTVDNLTHQSLGTPWPSSQTGASHPLCAGSWCRKRRCWWTASAPPPCWRQGWKAAGWSSTPPTDPHPWSGEAAHSSSARWREQWSVKRTLWFVICFSFSPPPPLFHFIASLTENKDVNKQIIWNTYCWGEDRVRQRQPLQVGHEAVGQEAVDGCDLWWGSRFN